MGYSRGYGDIISHKILGAHTKCFRKFTRLLLHLELDKKYITSWQKMLTEILPVTLNFFLWQEIFFCHKKYLSILQKNPLTSKSILWKDKSSCDRINSSCDIKYLPVKLNFFLCQYISSCNSKFLPVTILLFFTINFLLWHYISSWGKGVVS